jgi:ribosomal protein S12 methylthiotransferase accessory factor
MIDTARRDDRLLLRGDGVLFTALERGLGHASHDAVAVTAHDAPDAARDTALQRRMGQLGLAWLPVRADHTEIWAGPWIVPGGAGCIACLYDRAAVPGLFAAGGPVPAPAAPRFLPGWLASLLTAFVAAELGRVRSGACLLDGRVLVWSLATLQAALHPAPRLPGCPVCGPEAADSPDRARGTFAALASPVAVERAPGGGPSLEGLTAALVSPRAGLVRRVSVLDGPLSLALAEASVGPVGGNDLLSAGRATTPDEARRTALFETLERHAGFAPGGARPGPRTTYRELDGRALDPRTLVLHSPEQYCDPSFPFRPFHEDRLLTWVWGWSFRQRSAVAVPASTVYYGAWPGAIEDERIACETSSGCALGRSVAEAAARALLEVIERDGFLMAWYSRRTRCRLDLASARDPRIRLLAVRLERLGYTPLVWDVTQELGVPVMWATAVAESADRPRSFSGCGCNPDPEAAAWSALAEVACGLLHLEERYRREREHASALWSDLAAVRTMEDHGLLYAAPEAERALGFLRRDGREVATFEERFGAGGAGPGGWAWRWRRLFAGVIGAGLDVIAVDQTNPVQSRLGLAAVRVLVPGALPMTFGHVNRRLEGADRLARRLGDEDVVNPWPHPFP